MIEPFCLAGFSMGTKKRPLFIFEDKALTWCFIALFRHNQARIFKYLLSHIQHWYRKVIVIFQRIVYFLINISRISFL